MQPGIDPNQPQTQYINVQQVQPQQEVQYVQQVAYVQPVMPVEQQVVYINLKFKPKLNWRHWSYLALAFGIVIMIASVITGNDSSVLLGNSMCCMSIAVACFLDGAYYKTKSDWELSTGQGNGGSMTGMILDIIFGIICLGFAFIMIVGYGNPFYY